MALKYTKLLQFQTKPTFKDSDKNTVVLIKAKKALVQRLIFLKPLINLIKPLVTLFGFANTKITEKIVTHAVMTQVAAKIPGLNRINC